MQMQSVRSASGFTLIEMAVILIVVGLVLATFLPSTVQRREQGLVADAAIDVRDARDEMMGLAANNASVLPANAAQLSVVVDRYGGAILYAPAPVYDGTVDVCSVAAGDPNLMQVDYNGNGTIVSDVAFIIWSPGPNLANDIGAPAAVATIQPHGANLGAGRQFDDLYEFVVQDYLRDLLGCP